MINFTNNQRYSQRFFNGDWFEEVLAASGTAFDDTGTVVLSGQTEVQGALEALDDALNNLTSPPASGALQIDEVANVSGLSNDFVGSMESIKYPSTNDPTGGFSFTTFASPVDPVTIKMLYAPTTTGQTGTTQFVLEYNIFDQGDDLTPASEFPFSITGSTALVPGDFEEMKQLNFAIPNAQFSGSAPYIVNARLKRNTSGADTFNGDIEVIKVYADGVPGASAGSSPGYTGGNLSVTGDLTIENHLIYQQMGVTVPANSSSAGISGCIAYDNDYVYVCIATNTWRRSDHASF